MPPKPLRPGMFSQHGVGGDARKPQSGRSAGFRGTASPTVANGGSARAVSPSRHGVARAAPPPALDLADVLHQLQSALLSQGERARWGAGLPVCAPRSRVPPVTPLAPVR